ncbi:hypothetical protein [Vibrio vulnificus YJ016]|uniref:Uncharacterized protein n=1 Tax=Vibrio vulnificus (strain YJ016) TaxID=196600 RepID=Q7MPD9_VIBVY|nr:hypothetical protein [Vibrio vulnificus YJ016]
MNEKSIPQSDGDLNSLTPFLLKKCYLQPDIFANSVLYSASTR